MTILSSLNQYTYQNSDESIETFAELLTYSTYPSAQLTACGIDTPLGAIIAIADEKKLIQLQFADYSKLAREIEKLKFRKQTNITLGSNAILDLITHELHAYFEGRLKQFTTPLEIVGTAFQKRAWEELLNIPYGETRSYTEQAHLVGKPTAFRAVANANGLNQFVIVIPCHRIINHNGKLGGYGGGLARKQWLIEMEQRFANR